MKIIYILHQFFPMYWSGTEKSTLAIASNIHKNGNLVKIITYSFYDPAAYTDQFGEVLYRRNFIEELEVIDFRLKTEASNYNDVYYDQENEMRKFAEFILQKEKPHLVHIMHALRVSIFIKVLLKLQIPYMLTLTDFYLICPKIVLRTSKGELCTGPQKGNMCFDKCPDISNLAIRERLDFAKEIIYNSKFNIVRSKFVLKTYKKELPDIDFLLIRHGITMGSVEKNDKTYRKDNRIKFLFTGTLSEMKGVRTLINAFKKVYNAELYIYGKADTNEYKEQFLAEIDSIPNLYYKGMFEKEMMGEVVSRHDVMIIPSNSYETFSQVLHEAFACNVPVICSDVPALNEKVVSGVNGFTFKMGDAKQLRDIIEMLVSNPEILNKLKANIKKEPIMILEQEVYVYEKLYHMCI